MRRFFFGIQEFVWAIVAELEDALYPYRDREITHPMWEEKEIDIDEARFLKSQIEANSQRVERLQSEMIHVLKRINEFDEGIKSINTHLDIKNDQTILNEGQESSETNHQESKETP